MKSLLFIISVLCASLITTAQSIQTSSLGNVSGLIFDTLDETEISGYIDVTNNTGSAIDITTRYEVIYQEPNEMVFKYCWNLCYGSDTNESPWSLTAEDGETIIHGFNSDAGIQGYQSYYTSAEPGATTIRQFFYGPDDQYITHRDITYCLGTEDTAACDLFNSVEEVDVVSSFISAPYPNPASGAVNIDFSVSSGDENRIVILNSLGAEVKRLELNDIQGTATFSTDLLATGVYMCLLHTNGEVTQSSRLLVD